MLMKSLTIAETINTILINEIILLCWCKKWNRRDLSLDQLIGSRDNGIWVRILTCSTPSHADRKDSLFFRNASGGGLATVLRVARILLRIS